VVLKKKNLPRAKKYIATPSAGSVDAGWGKVILVVKD
jgi:hypothetical protein